MKHEFTEILTFDSEEIRKVGRPKLADKKLKKKTIIIASISFISVILLLIFGYGTLFGFKNVNLKGSINKNENKETIYVEEINPLVKDITLKVGTARKAYLTVLPAAASNKNIEYSSLNNSVATVDKNGKITGISIGTTTITATTLDGTDLSAEFNVTVIKNADGKCDITSLSKISDGINYNTECNNAVIKEVQYKVGNDRYQKLLTKKPNDTVKFSKEQLKSKITFKVVYYPNNSKVTKYITKSIVITKNTTKAKDGVCTLSIKEVKSSYAKYDISCDNATVTKIAYKIGNGSYVGLDLSSLADTVLFEESDVTRVIYFNIEYKVDGTKNIKSVTKNSIIEKATSVASNNTEETQNILENQQ